MKRIVFWGCLAVMIFSLVMSALYLIDTTRSKAVYKDTRDVYLASEQNSKTAGTSSQGTAAGNNTDQNIAGNSAPLQTEAGISAPLSKAAGNSIPMQNAAINSAPAYGKSLDTQIVKVQDKFRDLLKKNKDLTGWISIPGTSIDYPVVQADDNKYYLDHGITGEKSRAGAIFMDYRNNLDEPNRNIILYGHNMKNGTMFRDLIKYKKKDFFEKNRVIEFDTLYGDHQWEIFSAYVTDIKFNFIQTVFETGNDFDTFVAKIQGKSMHKPAGQPVRTDTVLTLSTCTYEYDDARFVVHARLLK